MGYEHGLLPQEVLEHKVEHALRVKDYNNPGYDFTKAEDVVSYVQEGLADLALGWSKDMQLHLRKLDFYAAVIGRVIDIPRGRPCDAYTHFVIYDEEEVIIGNQVDEFLKRIGFQIKENQSE